MRGGKRYAIVVGFDYYGQFLADLINEHSTEWRLKYYGAGRVDTFLSVFDARFADAIVSFGGPGPNVALVEAARRRKIPVIVIWAGTDVLTSKRDPYLLEVIKRYGFLNISDGPWLVDELREIGIDAEYVPVTAVEMPKSIVPLPSAFSVLTYLPEPRRSFYGEKAVYALAREFPQIPFRVVGRGEPNPSAPPNVEFLGYVGNMPQQIDNSTVILRLPEHDGKSMLVVESLARGRHVVWNYAFPGVRHVRSTADAARALAEFYAAHQAGTLKPNLEGHEFAGRNFRRTQLAPAFEGVLDRAVSHKDASSQDEELRRRFGAKRVAISGLELFCAQISQEVQAFVPQWQPSIMRTRVRLEVLTSMFTLLTSEVWYSIGAPIGDRWLHLFARALRKPRVIHWVGSDVSALRRNPALQAYCSQPYVRNIAEVDWMIEELRELGVDATIAPLPPRLPQNVTIAPLPDRFTVLLYLPRTRGDFYGRREYERLIRAFAGKSVRFLVVGGGEVYAPPEADVVRLGWCSSLQPIYKNASVLIRFTKHDGLSLMTLEALRLGRYVLWTQKFPYVTAVQNYEEIERAIATLVEQHENGTLEAQYEAGHFIAETYDRQRCVNTIVKQWDLAAVPGGRTALVAEGS